MNLFRDEHVAESMQSLFSTSINYPSEHAVLQLFLSSLVPNGQKIQTVFDPLATSASPLPHVSTHSFKFDETLF